MEVIFEQDFAFQMEQNTSGRGMAEAKNTGVKMYGVWGSGQGPGTRSDEGKRNATVGTWMALNTRLEISNWIPVAANLNTSPKKDSTGLGDGGMLSTLEISSASDKLSLGCPLDL